MIEILSSAGGLEQTIHGITEKFGVNWHLLFAQAVNFTVVAFLIWRFAFKGILSSVKELEEQIADSLKNEE